MIANVPIATRITTDNLLNGVSSATHCKKRFGFTFALMNIKFGIKHTLLLVAIVAVSVSANLKSTRYVERVPIYYPNGDELHFVRIRHGWPMDIGVPSFAKSAIDIGYTPEGGRIQNWKYYLRFPNPIPILANSMIASAILVVLLWLCGFTLQVLISFRAREVSNEEG